MFREGRCQRLLDVITVSQDKKRGDVKVLTCCEGTKNGSGNLEGRFQKFVVTGSEEMHLLITVCSTEGGMSKVEIRNRLSSWNGECQNFFTV